MTDMLFPWESKKLHMYKNIWIKDIERCPYVPSEPGYEEWNRKDDERLKQISEIRTKFRADAHMYLAHDDRFVRDMAIFIISYLEK